MSDDENARFHAKLLKTTRLFVDAVHSTGGVVYIGDRLIGCVADEDWLDLADAYLEGCDVLNKEPKIERREI